MTDQDKTGRQKLNALAAFLPRMETPDFSAGKWEGGEREEDSTIQMPWFRSSGVVADFVKAAYDLGWIINFDWPEWARTEEAIRLRDDPQFLATATADQLAKLLTVVVRQDRFVEGSLAEAFETGLIRSILQRAKSLGSAANIWNRD